MSTNGYATNPDAQWSRDDIECCLPYASWNLTPQQRNILLRFINEPNESRIARQLGLKVKTIQNHLYRIQRKLKVNSRVEPMKKVLESLARHFRDTESRLGKIPNASGGKNS